MKVKAFLCVFIFDQPFISCFFPAYSWVFPDFLARFLAFFGFLGKILGTSWFFLRGFFVLKTLFVRFFSRKNLTFFLARSCKIVHILGVFGKNLVKILTKGFRKLQDSWQEFQDILHWNNAE